MKILRKELVPWAVRAWADLRDRDGRLRFEHDAYLKIWQLGDPVIDAAYVLLDEAQDADPVVTAVLLAQKDMRVISVGDPAQQIYAWRGAIDAMDAFDGHQLTLSQSFRFGPAIADEANKWLELLGSDLVIRGTDSVPSAIGECEWPEAGLCRTNRRGHGPGLQATSGRRSAPRTTRTRRFRPTPRGSPTWRSRGRSWCWTVRAWRGWTASCPAVPHDGRPAAL